LWPCPRYEPGFDLNDNSLVLALRYGDVRFLFTGDVESEAERRLAASGRLPRVEVLKVAHHGSRTSSAAVFVDAVSPDWAVVSSGSGNRYGHPAQSVLRRLRASGARVWRTDVEGGLILRTDGRHVIRER
jgi:beta-lactamase superfamily II metal-dependent hydrolase